VTNSDINATVPRRHHAGIPFDAEEENSSHGDYMGAEPIERMKLQSASNVDLDRFEQGQGDSDT